MISVINVVRKRCPADATIMVHQMVDDLMGWVCPECGYFVPDNI